MLTNTRSKLEMGWTQEVLARNAEGKPVYPDHHSATCFCLHGAIIAGNPHSILHERQKLRDFMDSELDPIEHTGGLTLLAFSNDHVFQSQAEVLAYIDRLLKSLSAELNPT